MMTSWKLPGGGLSRQNAAFDYLKNNFCKGRAF
jgi:hypothetical protein